MTESNLNELESFCSSTQMNHQTVKIYHEDDFKRVTKGIKVAQCMQIKSAPAPEFEKITQLDDLVVSNSLSCSFCETIFENKTEQRLHYKLDWHRYNLKQRLQGLRHVTEEDFCILMEKEDLSSLSGSEVESDNEDDTGNSESGGSPHSIKNNNKNIPGKAKNRKLGKKHKVSNESVSDNSDVENVEEKGEKKDKSLTKVANRHSKVFFENDDGNIFSIYRCLLHGKKDIPEIDNEMISQALESGRNSIWTLVMVGGGHFAAAVFEDGKPIAHKTFHSYTVRAKQGTAQSSKDHRCTGGHSKSAGASLRRYNEATLTQHIQEILESWSSHIANSSLILYRAVGPHNRTVLFGGKNPPLDKNDPRLRPVPFPTRRATFSEIKRIYDILSNMEIYGLASKFADSFPISPRQPMRKKNEKNCIDEENIDSSKNFDSPPKPLRTPRVIDRAKPRKSPHRPLPAIVTKLARSSSESDMPDIQAITNNIELKTEDYEIEFNDHLQAFEDTVPRYLKNKKIRQQKRKVKKNRAEECQVNEVFLAAKLKMWSACQKTDEDVFITSLNNLKEEIEQCNQLKNTVSEMDSGRPIILVSQEDLLKLINDQNEDGNTMLHLASLNNQLKIIWLLLEIGSDPSIKNKKLQTPYVISTEKRTRNVYRKFMAEYPEKYDYRKSQVPGPWNEEIEQKELEKKKEQKKAKREREKIKKKEFEIKKQEEITKQEFLNLSDREKRALAAEKRKREGHAAQRRCFQCGLDLADKPAFEYNSNQFCSMPCLKEHRLHNKFIQ